MAVFSLKFVTDIEWPKNSIHSLLSSLRVVWSSAVVVLEEKASDFRPNYARFRAIVDKCGELFLLNMAHISGLVSAQDETKGVSSGWERFEFDKDAPLDDEELEVADDDVALVKHIGQSFWFSTIEARREEQIKAAHDEAMFGTSAVPPSVSGDSEPEVDNSERRAMKVALLQAS